MNATVDVDTGTGWRRVALGDYLDPAADEHAHVESRRWIKALRHLPVDGQPMRARFQVRGDSLWWFTEVYLHKEQAILTVMRALAAFDGILDRERPLHVRWVAGDPISAYVLSRRASARQIRFSGGPNRLRRVASPAALRVRAAMLHVAATTGFPRRPTATGPASIVAFVHRAFVEGTGTASGERYIGRVLEQIEIGSPRGSLRYVTLGPRRNFRARRWWDPLVGTRLADAVAIEAFTTDRGSAASPTVWRERHAWLKALERSEALRQHAIVAGVDCWPIVREQLAGVTWLQWPWSAYAMDQAGAALDALRPAVCVTYAEAGGWGRALALECRRRGIPLVGLQHGFIYRHWLNYCHEADEMTADPGNAADRGFPRPALTLVFDEYAARHLASAGQFPPGSVRVTGSPIRDDLIQAAERLTPADIDAARQTAGAQQGQHLFVLATKFTEAARVLPRLIEAVAALPSVHLAIKTHPAESDTAYAAAREAPNVTVLPASTQLAPLLAAARAVITVNSTVAVDAAAVGVPALVIGLPNNLSPFVEAGAMLGADGAQEIGSAIGRLAADEALRRSLVETGRRLTHASAAGGAAEASAGAILRLARERMEQQDRTAPC